MKQEGARAHRADAPMNDVPESTIAAQRSVVKEHRSRPPTSNSSSPIIQYASSIRGMVTTGPTPYAGTRAPRTSMDPLALESLEDGQASTEADNSVRGGGVVGGGKRNSGPPRGVRLPTKGEEGEGRGGGGKEPRGFTEPHVPRQEEGELVGELGVLAHIAHTRGHVCTQGSASVTA
jgi:hypothetical protein